MKDSRDTYIGIGAVVATMFWVAIILLVGNLPINSSKPIIPDLEITVENGKVDTLYIYKYPE